MPSFDELKYNASLLFANSHDSYSQSIKLPANCKLVGGYHIDEDVAPLPQASILILIEVKWSLAFNSSLIGNI